MRLPSPKEKVKPAGARRRISWKRLCAGTRRNRFQPPPADGGGPAAASANGTPTVPPSPSESEERPAEEPQPLPAGASRPPVSVSLGPDGRLVITSQDTAALDLLEEVIAQLAPPARDYEVFRIKHADAYWVMKNLEDFFKEEEDEKQPRSPFFYYYDYPPPKKEQPRYRLSKRRKLKFIYDLDTNSILVQGADPQQLKTIRDLIEVYDQVTPSDAQTARLSATFPIRYSKAEVIAEAVKDVYRDLLSANDKALAQNPEQRNRSGNQMTYMFGEGDTGAPERTQATFKGKLSIGVDALTNTLIVSAEGETLLKNVGEMIKTLDEAARPLSTVSVVPLKGNVNPEQVRKLLAKVLAESSTPAAEAKPPTPGGPPGGDRGRDRPAGSCRARAETE